MSRKFWFLILMLAMIMLWQRWQTFSLQIKSAKQWQEAQFRAPQVTRDVVKAQLMRRQSLRLSVPEDFRPEIDPAVKTEFEVWRKQFEKGEADRLARLSWQQQTEISLKQSMRNDLLDEAWLEQQLELQIPPVTELQVRAWFDAHAEELRVPPRYRVAHFFLSRHDPQKPSRAQEIQVFYDHLVGGKISFESLIRQYSEDERSKNLGGDLGWLSAERMPADLMNTLKHCKIGQVSRPVETSFGWHLFHVSQSQASRIPVFSEVQAEIEALLDLQRRTHALDLLLK